MHKRVQALVVAGIISANTISSSVSVFADEIANQNEELQAEGQTTEEETTEGTPEEGGDESAEGDTEGTVTPEQGGDENTEETLTSEPSVPDSEEPQTVETPEEETGDIEHNGWLIDRELSSQDCVVIKQYIGTGTDVVVPNQIDGIDVKIKTLGKSMFATPNSITSLTIEGGVGKAEQFSTPSKAFSGMTNLRSLNLNGFDLSNIGNMNGIFENCRALTTIEGFVITSHTTDLTNAFKGCSSLTSLDTTGWDVRNVNSMWCAFYGCGSLESLDTTGWVTSSVEMMNGMFAECRQLTEIIGIESWDTSKVGIKQNSINNGVFCMQNMFRDCSSLTNLDLKGWNVENVPSMEGMFNGCSS